MTHKGEIKLIHNGEVVRFHTYTTLVIMKTFIHKYRMDAGRLIGICSIDICPEPYKEYSQKKKTYHYVK